MDVMCRHHRHHHQQREWSEGRARPASRPSRPDERVGDAEREATLDRLAAHFAAGRLTEAELDERSTLAAEARTRGDLAALEADLPRAGRSGRSAQGRSRPRARGAHAAVLSAVPCHAWWAVPVGLVVLF